jgi:hypothetical protein
VQDWEVQILLDHYRHHPRRLATRSTNVFLAALAVCLMAAWIARMTGSRWLGLLVAAAFTTSPEMFVRSVYGGYTAINNILLIEVLVLAESWLAARSRDAWRGCLLGGVLMGWANQKLLPLAAAVIAWEFLRTLPAKPIKHAAKALLHPVALGFVGGSALFWCYGLLVSPRMFYLEHVRHHVLDRIAGHNPLGYTDYPTVLGLWREFWEHTGYLLLPLGLVALVALWFAKRKEETLDAAEGPIAGWRGTSGLWAVWALLTAVAFSLVDWRQTKHLMPLLIALHLAPARWAAGGPIRRAVVVVAFVVLLLWNLAMLKTLATDFASFHVTPAW